MLFKITHNFYADCLVFRKALFEIHGIRDCSVHLDRLADINITKDLLSKKKILPSKEKLRSKVNWLPTSSSVLLNAADAHCTLATYQEKNKIELPVARKNIKQQRFLLMLATRDDGQWNDMIKMKHSKDDTSELQTKFNSPNRFKINS